MFSQLQAIGFADLLHARQMAFFLALNAVFANHELLITYFPVSCVVLLTGSLYDSYLQSRSRVVLEHKGSRAAHFVLERITLLVTTMQVYFEWER